MPFPLAHPAAVLPLRRYCPRPLCFAALVIGSVTPDAGYLSGPLGVAGFSHTVLGSFAFCLPVGAGMMLLFYRLRAPLVARLPERHRALFQPLCQQPPGRPLAIGLSLLLGAWSHLAWDALTHTEGRIVERLPVLQAPLFHLQAHQLRVCHVLWYVSSFIGVAALSWTYERWRHRASVGAYPGSRARWLRNAVLMALLVFPLEALHHLFEHPLQVYAVGALTLALVVGVVWGMDRKSQGG